jgi:hypothetical protein
LQILQKVFVEQYNIKSIEIHKSKNKQQFN